MTSTNGETDELGAARRALMRGEVVGLPTDTVYGLGARADDPVALARLFSLKQRPEGVALPVVVADEAAARGLATNLGTTFSALAGRFWPGALTIVCDRRPGLRFELGGDGTTIGIRVPNESSVCDLARAVGPIALTSANRHGDPPCTSGAMVRASFRDADLVILDKGERGGLSSTVVSVVRDELRMLREGEVTLDELKQAVASHDRRG